MATPLPGVTAEEQQIAEAPRDTLLAAAKEMMAAARFCALITLDETGHPQVRAMDPFSPEEDMVIWFGTNRSSGKVAQIQNDPRVTVYYAHPRGAGYVSLYGRAELVDDPEEKAARWKEEWERYYPEKESTYLLIKVTPARMDVVDYTRNIVGNEVTWKSPSLTFGAE
jgi:general stress protein 26